MGWQIIPNTEWLETEEQIISASAYLSRSARELCLGFDTEDTGLDISKDIPIMFSLSDGIRRFACMAEPWLRHPAIKDGLLGNPEIVKVGSNIKYDLHMVANVGIPVAGDLRDTVVMDWLGNENRMSHGLKETAKDYLGLIMMEFKDVFPMKKATKNSPADTPGDAIRRVLADPEGRIRAINYASLDAYASIGVHNYLANKLASEKMLDEQTLWDYFLRIEVPFTRILWNMERRGFPICTGHLKAQADPMLKKMQELESELAHLAGWPVNLSSPKQLQKLFFEQLGIKPTKMTKGGSRGVKQPSTDEDVLEGWASSNDEATPYAKLVLKHRKLAKIYGTYVQGLLETVDNELYIHTTLNQAGTVSGRLSSARPNLQNLPRAKTDDFKIRGAFVALPGKILIVADYDQLEMKLMSHFSKDEKMCSAINNGLDLHCFTVSLMFNVPYEEVYAAKKALVPTAEQEMLLNQRQAGKTTGFGLIYGIGPKKLGRQLTDELNRFVHWKEAMNMIRSYFGVFPGVEAFIKNTKKYCHQNEYVQTYHGRFRRLPEINAKGGKSDKDDGINAKGIAAQAERQAVNSIIQGTAADVTKESMLMAEYDPELKSLGADLLLQIHDELIFQVDDVPEVIDLTKKRVKQIMEDSFRGSFRVPLTVECKAAYCWSDAK